MEASNVQSLTLAAGDYQLYSFLVAFAAVVVSGINMFYTGSRERFTLKYGVIYNARFRYSHMLYANLSKLRDAVEESADFQAAPDERIARYNKVLTIADTVRRAIRQDNILYPEYIAEQLNKLLATLRDPIHKLEDALRAKGDWIAERQELLKAIDDSRDMIRPYFRAEYGTGPSLFNDIKKDQFFNRT